MSLSQFVKQQGVNAPYNLDFFFESQCHEEKFSSKPMIRGLKKLPPSSHHLDKLARQMLAKGSANAPLFTREREEDAVK